MHLSRSVDQPWTKADKADFYADLGFQYHRRVRHQEAIRAYRRGLELASCNDRLHCLLGLTLHNVGDHASAITHYRLAAELNPSNSEAHYYLGFILIQELRLVEAHECLRRAIDLNPDLHPAYHYLAITLEKLGMHNEAITLLIDRIANSYPQITGEVIFTLGDLITKRRGLSATIQCHTSFLVQTLLEILGKSHLHCFGDSHRSVFNNLPNITCHNVGAGTAYNLSNADSSTGAGNKVMRQAADLDPGRDALILVFGEIDCMEHLLKNAYRNDCCPAKLIDELIDRYMSFVSQLTGQGFEVLIYGPSFSGLAQNSHGNIQQRSLLVQLFNRKLTHATSQNSRVTFAAIDDLLINPLNQQPRLELSSDGRHLDHFPAGSKVMQGIILSRFIAHLQAKTSPAQPQFANEANSVNHAIDKPWVLISFDSERPGSPQVKIGRRLNEKKDLEFYNRNIKEVALFIDLLDHQQIDELQLTTHWSGAYPLKGKGEITLITNHGRSEPLHFQLDRSQAIQRTSVPLRKETGRAVFLRLTWNSSDDLSRATLLLKNLKVIGRNYRLIPPT